MFRLAGSLGKYRMTVGALWPHQRRAADSISEIIGSE